MITGVSLTMVTPSEAHMYPVTHLVVNAMNPETGPVVPPAVPRERRRRRPRFTRLRNALNAPTHRYYLRSS